MTFGAGAMSFTKAFESGLKEHGLEPFATYAYASAQVGLRLAGPSGTMVNGLQAVLVTVPGLHCVSPRGVLGVARADGRRVVGKLRSRSSALAANPSCAAHREQAADAHGVRVAAGKGGS